MCLPVVRRSTHEQCEKKLEDCELKCDNQAQAIAGRLQQISELNFEVARLTSLVPREPPVFGAFIKRDGAWVQGVLDSYGCKMVRHPMDTEYWIPVKEDSLTIIEWDWTDKPPYVENKRDCDKFARRLWSNSAWVFGCNHFAFVNDWSGGHAYNMFLTPFGKLMIVEPQNDKIWEYDESVMVGMYNAESGRIQL